MGTGELSGKPDEVLGGYPCNGLVSHPIIILQEYKWVLVNCQGSLMKCWEGNLAMD